MPQTTEEFFAHIDDSALGDYLKTDRCKAAQRQLAEVFDQSNIETYKLYHKALITLLQKYRDLPEDNAARCFLSRTISSYARQLKVMCSPEDERRINSLILRYIQPEPIIGREIALIQHVQHRTVQKDFSNAICGLMPLVYGIDGILRKPSGQT